MDPKLSISDRRALYEKAYPKFPKMQPDPNWLAAMWIVGNWYKRPNNYWGSFPHTIVSRLLTFFPDCNPILHLFAGSIQKVEEKGVFTMDISPQFNPSICADIRELPKLKSLQVFFSGLDLVVADPYYETYDYETANRINKTDLKPLNKAQIIRDLGKYMKRGSFLAWLDTRAVMFSKETWQVCGLIGIQISTNTRYRAWTIWQRK